MSSDGYFLSVLYLNVFFFKLTVPYLGGIFGFFIVDVQFFIHLCRLI